MAGFNFDDYPDENKGFDFDSYPDEEGQEPGMGERIARGALRALPAAGAMFGGATGTILGMPAGPGAIATGVAGAGLGMAAGESLKNIGEHFIFGDEKTRSDIYAGPAKAALDGVTAEMGGQVIGKGLEVAAPYIKRGAEAVGDKTKTLANRFGARALGAERGTIKKLGAEKVDELGRYALDEGLLSPLASTDDVIARNAAKQAEGAAKMNQVYSAIDDAGESTFNPLNVAGKVDESIGGFYRSPINRGETNQLENTLESILMRGDKNIPLTEAQALKQELGKVANWQNKVTISDKERMAREAYGIVSKAIDDAAESGAAAIGKEGLEDVLKQGKQLYGNSKGAEELLTNKLAREQGNKLLGITDWGVLGAGSAATAVTGGAAALPTLATVAAKKGLEKYGAQNAALGLNNISKMLLRSPKMVKLLQENPAAFQSLAKSIEGRVSKEVGHSFPRAADKDNGNTTLMDRYMSDPNSASGLHNEKLKEQLEKQRLKKQVPVKEAQTSFIQGN